MDRHGMVRSANPAFMSKIKTLRLTMCSHEASAMVSARPLLNANILVLVNSVGRGGVQTILFDLKTNSSNILCTGLEIRIRVTPLPPNTRSTTTGNQKTNYSEQPSSNHLERFGKFPRETCSMYKWLRLYLYTNKNIIITNWKKIKQKFYVKGLGFRKRRIKSFWYILWLLHPDFCLSCTLLDIICLPQIYGLYYYKYDFWG